MSELTQAEKRERFIKKANENKAKFDKHLRLKKEVFGDMKPEHLKIIFENGAIDDLFSLKLIEYVDAYNECELKSLDLHNVVVPKGTLCDYCNDSKLDPKNKTLYYKPCPRCS
jgi:hypothetical protein